MRKIIALEFMSLDGVIQAPGGPEEDASGGFTLGGWTAPYFDEEAGKIMGEQMSQPFDLLLGRKTFEIFASYWPTHENDWPGINSVHKYVVSKSMTHHEWNNSVFFNNDVVTEIRQLKKEDGPNLQVYGSSVLMQTLLENDLVDELWLKIFPVTLGKGKRLFGDGVRPGAFKLIDSKVTSSGVIAASYKRAGEVKTGSVG